MQQNQDIRSWSRQRVSLLTKEGVQRHAGKTHTTTKPASDGTVEPELSRQIASRVVSRILTGSYKKRKLASVHPILSRPAPTVCITPETPTVAIPPGFTLTPADTVRQAAVRVAHRSIEEALCRMFEKQDPAFTVDPVRRLADRVVHQVLRAAKLRETSVRHYESSLPLRFVRNAVEAGVKRFLDSVMTEAARKVALSTVRSAISYGRGRCLGVGLLSKLEHHQLADSVDLAKLREMVHDESDDDEGWLEELGPSGRSPERHVRIMVNVSHDDDDDDDEEEEEEEEEEEYDADEGEEKARANTEEASTDASKAEKEDIVNIGDDDDVFTDSDETSDEEEEERREIGNTKRGEGEDKPMSAEEEEEQEVSSSAKWTYRIAVAILLISFVLQWWSDVSVRVRK